MFAVLSRLSSSSCHCLLLKPKLSSRQISFAEKIFKVHPNKSLVDKKKHRIVYELPEVRRIAGFIKLKYSLPFIAVVATPAFFAMEKTGMAALCWVGGSALNIGIIVLLSKFFKNLIGKVYINKEGDLTEVIVSALDESGRRLDRSHSPDDFGVCDFDFFGRSFGFENVFVKGSDIVYKVHVKFSKFHDREACKVLFGKEFVR